MNLMVVMIRASSTSASVLDQCIAGLVSKNEVDPGCAGLAGVEFAGGSWFGRKQVGADLLGSGVPPPRPLPAPSPPGGVHFLVLPPVEGP